MDQRPKKILYAASTTGHLRSFHHPYLKALTARGYAVTAAANGSAEDLPAGVDFLPVPFTKSFFSLRNLRAAWLLRRELRREHYDVVAVHTSLAAFFTRLGVLLAGKRDTRVVNTVHGYLFDDASSPLRRFVLLSAEKLTAPGTDDILVMNRADLEIARRHKLCRGQVTLIPGMGVDFSVFAPASPARKADARARFSLPEDGIVLVCAAECSKRKNQAFLIRSLARLPERYCLLLPGDGELLEECKALARALGVERRVVFPGRLADVAAAYAAADVCVSASRSEGLPFAVMEAMAAGLPAVLSDVKGHRDLICENPERHLYPFGDEAAFCLRVEQTDFSARHSVADYALDTVLPQVLPWYL